MSTTGTVNAPADLAVQAAAINAALAKCDVAATETLRWMIEAGRLLQEVRAKLPHGEYETWVRANCRVSLRMARLYRQAFQKSQTLKPETVSGFRTLREILDYCKTDVPRKKTKPGVQQSFSPEELEPWRSEWKNMPEFDQSDQTSWHRVIVHFKGPEDLKAFAARIGQRVLPTTRSIWFPPAEIVPQADKVYADES